MQVTNIIKVNAQIISGPDNVPSGTYSVPGLNPNVKYTWGVQGATSYTVNLNAPGALGAENQSADIVWNPCAPIHKIEVTEEPLFGNNIFPVSNLDAGNNLPPPMHSSADGAIEAQINAAKLAGGGTVQLPAGTFWVTSVLLQEGVRLEGHVNGGTILKRPDHIANDVNYNTVKMLNTYEALPFGYLYYSFLPVTNMNSKPIEIRNITLDGNKTVPDIIANPLYGNPQYPNAPATIPNPEFDANQFENSALIFLTAPYTKFGAYVISGVSYPNGYTASGPGKVKVFINNCDFVNSGGDAVCQEGNVDLTMSYCDSKDIYRGTHTETGGADIARLKNITTIPATANVRTKAIDYETGQGGIGFNNSMIYRSWIDYCNFDKSVHFDMHGGSKILLTNTDIANPPIYIIGYGGGDLVTNGGMLSFSPTYAEIPNYICAPNHAKFNNTIFNFKGSLVYEPVLLPTGCFNGLYYKNHIGNIYYSGSHIGFNGCTFNGTNLNPAYTSRFPFYVCKDANQNKNQNNPTNLQLFFDNCSKIDMNVGSDFAQLYNNYPIPDLLNNADFTAGVVNMNQVYTGGESEDEMKTHFGIRKIIQSGGLFWSNISFNNITCFDPLADNGLINVTASGGAGITSYHFEWPAPIPGNITQPTGLFSPIVEHIYTVTATDANGCTISTIIELLNPSMPGYNFCACPAGETIVATPNVILKVEPTASNLLSLYGNGNTITGKTFYIDDVFTIDDNIIFDNCTLWFTQSGQIVFAGPLTMDVSNSILQASCDWWLGIEANAPQQKVAIDQSTIRDMQNGILIANDAVLEATNSNFLNNANRSIKFSGMNDPAYSGFVEGNTFDGMQYECAHGIEIFNSNYINIGNAGNTNSGNSFKELNNGIDIRGDASIGALLGPSNQIGIYNNKFEDIQANPPNQSLVDINNTVYTSVIGAAVNIDYTSAANTFSGHTTVSYTGANTSATILFDRCSKGIVSQNSNLITEKLYMKDTWFGIMNRNMASKEVYLALNKIENTAIGTQLIGNYDNYDVIENDIILNEGIGAPYNGNPQQVLIYPAIGIDIKQLNPPYNPAETFNILTNTITIPYWAGKGIGNLGANKSQLISNNSIFFTVPNGTAVPQVPAYDPSLYGIYNSNCKEMKLDGNLVQGQYSLLNYDLTFSKAFYFETSHNMELTCNKGGATKQGFYVFGSCTTGVDKVQFNKFRFNLNPLYTLDNGAAQVGTFGEIGDGVTDNGNDWTYNMNGNVSWLQGNLFKVWRNSGAQPGYFIKTTPGLLLDAESGSPGGISYPYRYLVTNPANMTYSVTCPDPNFGNANPPNLVYNQDEIDIENAEAVALQQQTYINYAEVGQWLNNRNLYEQLALDTALRNSSLVLTNFFNNYANSTIHDITQTDIAMSVLFEFKGAEIEMVNLYNAALDENKNITSNNDYELYEQTINNVALRLTRYGKDSISELQKTELAFIAHLCPFIGGTAVYKARVLWGMYSPITQYNDRLTCIQGQNKNGNSGYVNLDSLYEAQTNEQATILANEIRIGSHSIADDKQVKQACLELSKREVIVLYPNPATDFIKIESSKKGTANFILHDALGKEVLNYRLIFVDGKGYLKLPNLANGLYTYKIKFTDEIFTGKLNILK